jgi:hypothetical protein
MAKRDRNRPQVDKRPEMPDPQTLKLEDFPISHHEVEEYYLRYIMQPHRLRAETMKRIENITGNTLLCYFSEVQADNRNPEFPLQNLSIDDGDIDGFDNLIETAKQATSSDSVDILIVSNGGSPESAERIINLLRENFTALRFILPSNAFSAATMMAFACDSILMLDTASLGPIDPQLGGLPARAYLKGFEDVEKLLKEEGPDSIVAYMPLLEKYSLPLLQICKNAELLSSELATNWLSSYMLRDTKDETLIPNIVEFFASHDLHKSHARSINRTKARELGLNVEFLDRGSDLTRLVKSLYNQFAFFLRITAFYKIYENAYGTNWGRQWITEDMLAQVSK